MKILIVAATQAEIQPTLAHFKLGSSALIETEKFEVLITGVGMVATAFALGQILQQNYNLVVNVGIAGSFDNNIPLGKVVNVVQDTFAELGAENHEDFISLPALGFGENKFENTAKEQTGLMRVKGITVNKVHGNAVSIEQTIKRYQPATESMEGAAVFYACQKLNIPALQIRSISNYVEPRNRENWQVGVAVSNLNEWLIDFLTKL